MPPNVAPSRRRRLVRGVAFGLVLPYLVLLTPEPSTPFPKAASRESFAWNQDHFWAGLQKRFSEARKSGCDGVSSRVHAGFQEMQQTLAAISREALPPQDLRFGVLETQLFELAPLVAVCPQRLPEYAGLLNQARAEVKRQSQQWDMNSPAARERIYRLLFGARNALEEVILQAGPAGLPEVVALNPEPSMTPSVEIHGVRLHSGDLLVSRGGAPTSALIARGNDYPGNFSHVALLHIDAETRRVSVIESHIESGVGISSFEDYLQQKKLRILVLRLRSDLPAIASNPRLPHEAASAALTHVQRHPIPYDFSMDYSDPGKQFCSEVASAAYAPFGIRLWMSLSTISSPTVAAWLASLGVRHFETQEPSDLEYDPQLRPVAEWCDRETLLKARVDDAVTDAMLEAAPSGRGLPHNHWLLPFSRLSKAYSVVLNQFGKTGPVPEGMSATTALRVKKYLADHQTIAGRVMTAAEAFKSTQGYLPPYWELVKMAEEQAKH